MQQLIDKLMEKDEKKRPRIMEIIRLPFVQAHMTRYAQSCGKSNLNPNLKKRAAIQPEAAEELARMKSANPNELRPQDQQKILREEKLQADFEGKIREAEQGAKQQKYLPKEDMPDNPYDMYQPPTA